MVFWQVDKLLLTQTLKLLRNNESNHLINTLTIRKITGKLQIKLKTESELAQLMQL
jgi:hypothetical protein